ncbi:hypothetical protein DBR46_05330 [Pseudomonas sp. KBW05]|nr:hypothetical protein DBR46_05330 [Pseudomonas sp. KBW05]
MPVFKTESPASRASPLPHLTAFQRMYSVKCGSGLAREGANRILSPTPKTAPPWCSNPPPTATTPGSPHWSGSPR